jgi:hypothetical protein
VLELANSAGGTREAALAHRCSASVASRTWGLLLAAINIPQRLQLDMIREVRVVHLVRTKKLGLSGAGILG